MRVIYIADDGKEFDDEFECEHYEWALDHPHIKEIVCYDRNGNVLEDIFSQDTYETAMKIVVPTDEAAKELREVGRYCGFCNYIDIESAGVWVWGKIDFNWHFTKAGD